MLLKKKPAPPSNPLIITIMNKRKKASYGMKKMRGGDYMEPNKELKFGAAKGKKPKRRKAGKGDTVKDGTDKPKGSAAAADNVRSAISGARNAADNVRNTVNSTLGRGNNSSSGAGAARRRQMQEEATRNSPNPPAGTDPKKGTPVDSKKANPYSAAKKRDSNLDSYIKARNAAEKGSNEYNDAQNKINKAYGKGPTNRRTTYGPEKKGETAKATSTGKSAATAMSSQSKTKPTLERNMTSTKTPATKSPTKKESRQTGRAAMKDRRQSARSKKAAAKEANVGESRKVQRIAGKMAKANVKGKTAKSDRAVDRFTKAKGRESERAANQQSRADKRDDKQFDRNERKGAKADRKNRLADIKANKKSELKAARGKAKMGGPRRKAVTGMAVQAAGAGLQGIGKLTNAIAGKETKFGKIADAAGSTAVTAGGMMGGVPGAQTALEGVKGAIPPPGGAAATPPPAPAVDPTQQPDPNAQPQARYGRKKKGKKGMMKYKAGGAKPDFPDLDKDGNKTEPMTKALKDRRSKAKMGKKR